jgi:membrane protease YdiL (CAAX protease family)
MEREKFFHGIRFLRNESSFDVKKFDLLVFFRSVCLFLIFSFFSTALLFSIFYLIEIPFPKRKLEPILDPINHFFISVIVAAFTEEIVFRLILRYTILNFAFFFSFSILFFLIKTGIIGANISDKFGIYLLILALSTLPTLSFLNRNKHLSESLKFYHDRFHKYIVYLSAFAFGVMHVELFQIDNVWQVFVCVPYIVNGLIFSAYRLRYGILSSLLLHGAINAIAFSFTT